MGKVYQAGASIDERGKATGGQAGNQTGAELRIRQWYIHSKGWYIVRAIRDDVRLAIEKYMRNGVKNQKIGYDQAQRYTLYNQTKSRGFDPAAAVIACECDCSSLVATCVQAAFLECGIKYVIPIEGFRTTNMVARLKETGQFIVLSSDKYCARTDGAYLKRGDIACTRTQGHTVAIVTDGVYANEEDETEPVNKNPALKKGSTGEAVKTVQNLLLKWEPAALPKYGADSDFGAETDIWVRKFQLNHAIIADGVVGEKTWIKLLEYAVKTSPDGDDGVESEAPKNPVVARRAVISKGDQGEDVKEAQTKLIAWNKYALPKYKADGDFGVETVAWVRMFQDANKLKADGVIGSKTWAALDLVKMEANG